MALFKNQTHSERFFFYHSQCIAAEIDAQMIAKKRKFETITTDNNK